MASGRQVTRALASVIAGSGIAVTATPPEVVAVYDMSKRGVIDPPLLPHLLAAILHVLRVFRRVRGLRLSALLLGMLGMTGVGIGGGRALRGGGCRDGKRQCSKKYSHLTFSKI